ncbi:hypothetical protein [Streptomyces sp. NPDC001165]|uniref:hypothetical protein n=1 Tax=Streptomyces sp. NPDC001165 TaxID=3364546 RepID=UPI0036934EB0
MSLVLKGLGRHRQPGVLGQQCDETVDVGVLQRVHEPPDVGEAAAAACGALNGRSAEAHLKEHYPVPLDPAGVARAIVSIATHEELRQKTLLAVTGKGLEAI